MDPFFSDVIEASDVRDDIESQDRAFHVLLRLETGSGVAFFDTVEIFVDGDAHLVMGEASK
jgi:hypothetical protein